MRKRKTARHLPKPAKGESRARKLTGVTVLKAPPDQVCQAVLNEIASLLSPRPVSYARTLGPPTDELLDQLKAEVGTLKKQIGRILDKYFLGGPPPRGKTPDTVRNWQVGELYLRRRSVGKITAMLREREQGINTESVRMILSRELNRRGIDPDTVKLAPRPLRNPHRAEERPGFKPPRKKGEFNPIEHHPTIRIPE